MTTDFAAIKTKVVLFGLISLCPAILSAQESGGHTDQTKLFADNAWSDNSRWAVDLSMRSTRDLRQDETSNQFVAGFDFHKVFSNRQGDIGTLVFQPYWVQLDNVKNPPFFFDSGDDGELTWRIANFNYTALSAGRFNIRAGHFEVPFGLEQNIDTNGTTRQFTFSDRGIKADWGLSVNGTLPSFDYEIALTRGSGNNISDRDDPFVFSGRIGTPATANLVTGFSWLNGDILSANGTTTRRRLGLDLAYYYRQWETLFEISGGDNNGNDTANALAELSWRNPLETVHTYLQLRHVRNHIENEWDNASNTALGINWNIYPRIDIGAEWHRELDTFESKEAASRLAFQFRVRL